MRDATIYECYKGEHLKFLIIIVIPSLIIWSFGIPVTACVLLLKNKTLIEKDGMSTKLSEKEKVLVHDMKIKYGFIFSGYKLNSYYYEVVI